MTEHAQGDTVDFEVLLPSGERGLEPGALTVG